MIRSSGCLRKVAAVSVEVGLLSMLNAILHDGDTAYGGMCLTALLCSALFFHGHIRSGVGVASSTFLAVCLICMVS